MVVLLPLAIFVVGAVGSGVYGYLSLKGRHEAATEHPEQAHTAVRLRTVLAPLAVTFIVGVVDLLRGGQVVAGWALIGLSMAGGAGWIVAVRLMTGSRP